MVRNARSVPPSCIDISMEGILVTPTGSETSSMQKARKSLSSPRRNTRRSPGKSISWRNKLLIKGKSTSSTRSSTRRSPRKILVSFSMTLRRATPPQAVRTTVHLMKGRKTPSPTTQSRGKVTRVATALPTLMRKPETMVAEN